MKHSNSNFHRFIQLLSPSWLSGLACVAVPVVFVGIVVFVTRFQGPIFQGDLQVAHHATIGISSDYLVFARWIDQNQYTRNLPLFIFWAATGLAIYTFVLQLSKGFNAAVDLEHEIHYVHSHPILIVREAFLRLIVRLLSVVGLTAVVLFTLKHLVPNCMATAYVEAFHATLSNAGLLLAAVGSLVLGLWLQVIFLRLLFLRVRLFGNVIE